MDVGRALLFSFAFLVAAINLTHGARVIGLGDRVGDMQGGSPVYTSIRNGPPPPPPGLDGMLLGGRDAASLARAVLDALTPQGPGGGAGGPRDPVQGQIMSGGCNATRPCVSGLECCLLRPKANRGICQRFGLSGKPCSWSHCTERTSMLPSPNTMIYGNSCHCIAGNCCLASRRGAKPFDGSCTFL